MKNIRCFLVISQILFFLISSEAQENIHPSLIREISTGNTLGTIGFVIGNDGGRLASPNCFFFDNTDLLVIDDVNKRLTAFNANNMGYKKAIEDVDYRNSILAYSDKSLFWLIHNGNVTILDKEYKAIKSWPIDNIPLVARNGFLWGVNEQTSSIECYDQTGKKITGPEAIKIMVALNYSLYSGEEYNREIGNSIKELIEAGKSLILDGKIVTRDYKQASEYYGLFRNTKWREDKKDLFTRAPLKTSQEGQILVGFNDEGLSCWKFISRDGSPKIYLGIISPYGDLVAYFNYDEINPRVIRRTILSIGAIPDFNTFIDPIIKFDDAGNIWFMIGYPNVIKFYKVERTW